ncbi:MAG: ABC transporter ATP-binding protein [Candidatus Krumholzibacteriia bacterium]|nr:ABC transporter ATP-binding protein [Candidatus Latescibacterota bacterium]
MDIVVELKGATRRYVSKGETVLALDHVDLSVTAGEFLALAGPSGSGKSTLLNLVGGLDRPSEGRVIVEGRDLGALSGKALAALRRERLGFVFQSYNLVPVLSAVENVEYVMLIQGRPAAERRARAMEVLQEVGLAGMEHRRPASMSGGQQQRVAVARAIAARPALVLADEPTANLDTATGDALLDLMASLNARYGTTFIFSTHDTRIMERASRLVRLRDGRVASDERHSAVVPA